MAVKITFPEGSSYSIFPGSVQYSETEPSFRVARLVNFNESHIFKHFLISHISVYNYFGTNTRYFGSFI